MTVRIRNYTSTVSPTRTIAAIEEMLGRFGASRIGKTYVGGEVIGFVFQLLVDGRPITFKLPCKWEPVEQLLTPPGKNSLKLRASRDRQKAIHEQAQRTAWRLTHDWIAVQLAMIQLGQAEAMQVFLPYAYDVTNDMTFFERVREGGFKQLAAPVER